MGARAVPLDELTDENAEICGFNGRPTVNCGFSLPIVLHKPTGLYCALSITRESGPIWSTEQEIHELETSGRITLLSGTERPENRFEREVTWRPAPIEWPWGWNFIPPQQPVVVWVKEVFLHDLSMTEKDLLQQQWTDYGNGMFPSFYKCVPSHDEPTCQTSQKFYATCAEIVATEPHLDHWGQRAKGLFDKGLTDKSPNWFHLEALANDGLCAARDRGLRYWLYVRYCASIYFRTHSERGYGSAPERAYRIFQVFVEPAYQGVTWERFRDEMFVIVGWAQDVRRLTEMERSAVSRTAQEAVQRAVQQASS